MGVRHGIAACFALWSASWVTGQTLLQTCGRQTLPIVMEQVPTAWWSYNWNNDAMWLWNQYVDLYRYTPDNGTWGQNSASEFAGWPSNAELQATWGFTWGAGALALTAFTWNCQCCQITETDVAFNPAYSWTSDPILAEASSSNVHYLSVLLHELGHTWGYQNINETYNYAEPSVMHAYYGQSVHPDLSIHAADAYLIRAHHAPAPALPRSDMATFSHYASGSLYNSYTTSSSYQAGSQITVRGLTVENTGTGAASNPHIQLFLSSNRFISVADILLGDWYWPSFPSVAQGAYDLTATIPASVPPGTYWVGAIVTSNGYGGDDLFYNDTTRLFSQVSITQAPCSDDVLEPNDTMMQATPLGPTSFLPLQLCAGDEDWFRFQLGVGQRLDVSIAFSNFNGDLDLELYDASMNLMDWSYSIGDGEWVTLPLATSAGPCFVRVLGMQNTYWLQADLSTPASCIYRNGSGVNLAGFDCMTAPALGTTWSMQVPTDASTLQTLVAIATAAGSGLPFLGGELLLDAGAPSQLHSALGVHSIPIPNDPAFLGAFLATQAFRVGSSAGALAVDVFNGQDIRLGF